MKNDKSSAAILPTTGTRPVQAQHVPPLRRVTMDDVRTMESQLRQRRPTS
jgi:hypothetical protein